jgi:transcriptional antiterminator Rof (Rho-off)
MKEAPDMGASGVISTIKGTNPRDAYTAAVQEARYESGSGGYTGSIAESAGFVIADTTPKLIWEAQQIADHMLSTRKVQKWGPTALIPVAEATAKRMVTIPVEVTGMDYEQQSVAIHQAIKAKLRAGESIEAVKTTTDTKSKIAIIAAEGEAKTVYIVKDKWGRQAVQFPTLTAAKKAAKTTLERNPNAEAFTITKQVVKGDSEVLVTVERQTTRAVITITATVGKPKAGPVDTWVAVGLYSE